MEIKKAEFVTSAVTPNQFPGDPLPRVALVGKSNVGKSSLINSLANNFKLARTSSTSGKTRTVNFYKINEAFYFVDLPGYGFARVSDKEKKKWAEMVEGFLSQSDNLVLIIHLIDIRHKPTGEDIQMMEWTRHFGLPVAVVATKADKLGKTRWPRQVEQIRRYLGITSDITVIPFSVQNRTGRDSILDCLESSLNSYHRHFRDL